MSSAQLQNIAPAPPPTAQQMPGQPQMSQMAAPGAAASAAHPSHPLMSPGGQPIQQMSQPVAAAAHGQYQIIQPQIAGTANAATAQYMPQVATYNPQGQLVLQPANFAGMQIMQATQQPGQQQYILTAATPQAGVAGQKPGQPQMIASSPQQQGTGKPIAPMSQATAGYTLTTPGIVSPASGTAGAGQTYIMANQIPGQLMGTGQPMAQIPSSMSSQLKHEPGKSTQPPQHQALSGAPPQAPTQPGATSQHHLPQQAQAVMLPAGMTYMQPQQQQPGQPQTQAIFQNGQLFFQVSWENITVTGYRT